MESKLSNVAVQITRFLDPHNPGVVECILADVDGHVHRFIDKVPIFTGEQLDAQSTYPCVGEIRCKVVAQWLDTGGRPFARISTLWPDGIESTEGRSEFVVTSDLLSAG